MNEYFPTIVVVCGYGGHLVPELQRYLDAVAEYINRHKPHIMVLCGGCTQQESVGWHSEAIIMLEYLERPGKLTHWPRLLLEEGSFTSYENIRGASQVIRRDLGRGFQGSEKLDARIVIFCEASRALKVKILARHFFGFPPERGLPDIEIRTVSWELMHPLKELQATIYDALSLYIPGLAWFWGWKRRRKAKLA